MTSDIERFEFDELAVRELVALREEIGKPVFLIPGHVVESREGMSLLTKNGIPSFTTPERAAKVLAAMVGYTNHLNRG
jgi:acyl-CoA synthetase (NDP forming)